MAAAMRAASSASLVELLGGDFLGDLFEGLLALGLGEGVLAFDGEAFLASGRWKKVLGWAAAGFFPNFLKFFR